MLNFVCDCCQTVGIVSPVSGGFIVSPCDCVAVIGED